jgi:hypothetical protein
MAKFLWTYFLANKIFCSVGLYFIASAVLKAITAIDVCIPCFWKTVFDITCPSCGLTRAFICLLHLDFQAAYEINGLIFIVLPLCLYFIANDLIKHKHTYLQSS